jgi:hypothetical protein
LGLGRCYDSSLFLLWLAKHGYSATWHGLGSRQAPGQNSPGLVQAGSTLCPATLDGPIYGGLSGLWQKKYGYF